MLSSCGAHPPSPLMSEWKWRVFQSGLNDRSHETAFKALIPDASNIDLIFRTQHVAAWVIASFLTAAAPANPQEAVAPVDQAGMRSQI